VALGYSFNDTPSAQELAAVNAVPNNYTTAFSGAVTLAGGRPDPNLVSSLEGVESMFFMPQDLVTLAESPSIAKAIVAVEDQVSGYQAAQDMKDAYKSSHSKQSNGCN
jgi:hypothetical protein